MNYRHAFHAGNHADVLKHAVLAAVLAKLNEKAKPYRVLDVHAGAGLYDLRGVQAVRTGEWQSGFGKMTARFSDAVEGILFPYRNAIASVQQQFGTFIYPGSPAISLQLMRAQDRLICNDLHPEEAALLRQAFQSEARLRVSERDAVQAVKAELPFDQRRGVVLIDPPYESPRETELTVKALVEGKKRFANGVYLIWYPIKGESFADEFAAAIAATQIPDIVQCELRVKESFDGGGLAGSGLLIVNPPYQLREKLQVLLPALAERLGIGRWGRGDVSDLTPPAE